MSSTDFRVVREPTGDPLTKYVKKMQQTLAKKLTKDAVDQLDSPEDIYSDSQTTDSAAKYGCGCHNHSFNFNVQYFPIEETEFMWIKAYNMGTYLKDFGYFAGKDPLVPDVKGDPVLIDGEPFDHGAWVNSMEMKSHALRFNREGQDYTDSFAIPHYGGIDADNGTGFSIFIRFRPRKLDDDDDGFRTTLVSKANETSGLQNAYQITMNGDRRINIMVKRDGAAAVKKETATGVILDDVLYDAFITWQDSTDTIRCFLGRYDSNTLSEQTLFDCGYGESWDLADTNLWFGRKGGGTIKGRYYGDLYDLKFINSKYLSYDTHGSSVFLDGTDDYINCGNHSDLWSKTLTNFSMSMWVYPTNTLYDVNRDIFRHGATGGGRFRTDIQQGTGVTRFYIRNNADNADVTASTTAMVQNQWNHIVCTYDKTLGSQNLKIFRNTVQGSVTGNHTETLNSVSTNMGLGGNSGFFQGYIRDFRFWNALTLSPTQINNVYIDSYSAPFPSYWLRLIEGTGTPTDQIGNTKTATLTSGAAWISDEVGNHWKNKLSTSGIKYGEVPLANHCATYEDLVGLFSFTTTSFTATSFTAG